MDLMGWIKLSKQQKKIIYTRKYLELVRRGHNSHLGWSARSGVWIHSSSFGTSRGRRIQGPEPAVCTCSYRLFLLFWQVDSFPLIVLYKSVIYFWKYYIFQIFWWIIDDFGWFFATRIRSGKPKWNGSIRIRIRIRNTGLSNETDPQHWIKWSVFFYLEVSTETAFNFAMRKK